MSGRERGDGLPTQWVEKSLVTDAHRLAGENMRWILSAILVVTTVTIAMAQDRGVRISAHDLATMQNERRVALVIGNGNYAIGPLRNPINDARAMSRALRGLGFEVIEKTNIDYRQTHRAIVSFGKKIQDGGVGLFFFSGHGVQIDGENYLLPIGAEISAEEHVEAEGIGASKVLARMGGARNRLNIVILDACRDNPLAKSFKSSTRGLAQMSAPSGTFIAYATAPGEMAADGTGNNSPFTASLIEALSTSGLKLEEVFKRVRTSVWKRTGRSQVPWSSSSIMGDFYFRLPTSSSVAAPQVASLPPASTSGVTPLMRLAREAAAMAREEARLAKEAAIRARQNTGGGYKVFTWPSGERFEGEYRDDKINGRGVYTWPSGERFEGEYRDNKRNGRGVLTNANGSVKKGTWKDGEFVSRGRVR